MGSVTGLAYWAVMRRRCDNHGKQTKLPAQEIVKVDTTVMNARLWPLSHVLAV